MANLTFDQLHDLAERSGFSGSDANIAAAVAMAESGGNPTAHNTTPPDDSYGLWQINMYKDLGPGRRKQFGISSNSQLFDPATNAKAAKSIFDQSGWKAWTTYTSGKYKTFVPAGAPDDGTDASESTGTGITGAVNAIGVNLLKMGENVGGIIIALVFVVLGVVILLRKPLLDMTPVGKIGKVAKKL